MNKIIIATHKSYVFPQDDMYLPLFVGAKGKEDVLSLGTIHLDKEDNVYGDSIMRDDTAENISEKNPYFCELTGLYWAWKNLTDADVVGLVHYRRLFTVKSKSFRRGHYPARSALTSAELDTILASCDMVVPKKRVYGVETLYSHYEHTLDSYQLDVAYDMVRQLYPEYATYVPTVYKRRWGYMFNMFIAGYDLVDEYCEWLFKILFAMEDRLIEEGYMDGLSGFEARLYGRVSEILFNVWLEYKLDRGLKITEVPVMSAEKEDWIKKGKAFCEAKFFGKKYGASF